MCFEEIDNIKEKEIDDLQGKLNDFEEHLRAFYKYDLMVYQKDDHDISVYKRYPDIDYKDNKYYGFQSLEEWNDSMWDSMPSIGDHDELDDTIEQLKYYIYCYEWVLSSIKKELLFLKKHKF